MTPPGIVMLVHTALDRAAQVARFWARGGCPVVIHVDRAVPHAAYQQFTQALSGHDRIVFSRRHRCEWGTWGIVAATQDAAAQMLRDFPEVRHVYLTSGACLPLRPVRDLTAYLDARPRTDFIESATTADVSWTVGGLEAERFTLRFPFSWRRHRRMFDLYVQVQRHLRIRRRLPKGIVPHMGSQWWCLTRQTLSAILQDPDRPVNDRYFKRVWIPDESYFQTLARLWSTDIESRSLTLARFDHQGKPHVFYDDHLNLLRRSDCFVARKIWPRADRLYAAFLADGQGAGKRADPAPSKIDRLFAKAADRRTRGRRGLYMQSRFPRDGYDRGQTAARFCMFQGFDDLFVDFPEWLERTTGLQTHGHLFAPDRAHFAGGARQFTGALSDHAALRDANPRAFLSNLIWNTRGQRQAFLMSPRDMQTVMPVLAQDNNADIAIITGAWAVPLFRSNANFADLRTQAAQLQRTEEAALQLLRAPKCRAQVQVWPLAEFVEAPMEPLQALLNSLAARADGHLAEVPRMVDLGGFGQFLQNLKNQGMHPYLTGNFPPDPVPVHGSDSLNKPYLVKK